MTRELASIEGLERGVAGTKKTLDKMHRLVALGKLHPTMQRIATWIRLQVPQDDRARGKPVVDAVFRWVKRHGIFQRDPFQIEKIEHPIAAMSPIVEARAKGVYKGPGLFVGDCDTISGVYLATLLGVLGFHYAWETAKVDPSRPDEFSHVWTAVQINGEWYPLDPSTRGAGPGWKPPVPPELFARWPEKAIEKTLPGGVGMSGYNGNGRAYVPQDYYGSDIQRVIGNGPMEIPDPSSSDLQLLPPKDTEVSRANLEPGIDLIRKYPVKGEQFRVGPSGEQPEDHGPPYYRKGRQPQYRVERYQYPLGSVWNKRKAFDSAAYRGKPPYYHSEVPASPERKVEVAMAPVFRVRPELVTRPKQVPVGMSQDLNIVTQTDLERTEAAVESAGTSVWESISKTLSSAIPAAASVATATIQAKAAEALAKATNTVASRAGVPAPVTTPQAYLAPSKAWYESPYVWIGGALVAAGGAYVVATSGGGRRRSGRRRRR